LLRAAKSGRGGFVDHNDPCHSRRSFAGKEKIGTVLMPELYFS
jgi:hypothetical protein